MNPKIVAAISRAIRAAVNEGNYAVAHGLAAIMSGRQVTRTPPREARSDGWVYFAQAEGSDRVKIGWALDPKLRLVTLQTGCPAPLKLLAITPGDRCIEAEYHREFAHLRIVGEWFRLGDELQDCIDDLENIRVDMDHAFAEAGR